jgi:hypothetical protein
MKIKILDIMGRVMDLQDVKRLNILMVKYAHSFMEIHPSDDRIIR